MRVSEQGNWQGQMCLYDGRSGLLAPAATRSRNVLVVESSLLLGSFLGLIFTICRPNYSHFHKARSTEPCLWRFFCGRPRRRRLTCRRARARGGTPPLGFAVRGRRGRCEDGTQTGVKRLTSFARTQWAGALLDIFTNRTALGRRPAASAFGWCWCGRTCRRRSTASCRRRTGGAAAAAAG